MDLKKVIAVDGLSASGKGTLARKLAQYFDFSYLDTGKLYRAVSNNMIENNKDMHSTIDILDSARNIKDYDLSDNKLNNIR